MKRSNVVPFRTRAELNRQVAREAALDEARRLGFQLSEAALADAVEVAEFLCAPQRKARRSGGGA